MISSRRTPRSLARIWFGAGALITIGAAVTFLVVFRLGLVPAVVAWEAQIGTATAVRLQGEIERILRFRNVLEEDDLRDFVGPYVSDDEFLIVFGPTGDRLYAKAGGRVFRRPTSETAIAEEFPSRVNGVPIDLVASGLYRGFLEAGLLRPLEEGGTGYGYIAAGTTGFAYSAANRHLYGSLITALTVAIALTTVAAVTVVTLLSRHLNRGFAQLISRLRRTADGTESDPELTSSTGILELDGLEHEIRRLQRFIQEERRVRRDWAMDIAHDLRTPVTALRAQLEAVQDGVFQPEPARITTLLDHVANLESLVQSFLLLTRVEAPDYHPQLRAVDGTRLISAIVERYHDQFRLAGHNLTFEIPGSLLLEVDPELIQRAITNLLDNALTHGAPGSTTVKCAIAVPGESSGAAVAADAPRVIRFAVQNHGTIDPAFGEILFDRFARSQSKGHGLGLALVAAIAGAHGGRPVAFIDSHTVEIGFEIPAP